MGSLKFFVVLWPSELTLISTGDQLVRLELPKMVEVAPGVDVKVIVPLPVAELTAMPVIWNWSMTNCADWRLI